jgi:hypothetical protein
MKMGLSRSLASNLYYIFDFKKSVVELGMIPNAQEISTSKRTQRFVICSSTLYIGGCYSSYLAKFTMQWDYLIPLVSTG